MAGGGLVWSEEMARRVGWRGTPAYGAKVDPEG